MLARVGRPAAAAWQLHRQFSRDMKVLDVLCDEPPRDPQSASAALLGLGEARAVVTPHVAWGTLEARRRLCAIACENARAFVQDGSTPNRVDGVQ